MQLEPLTISNCWLISNPNFPDKRGFFVEWFNRSKIYEATGFDFEVQQSNVSKSTSGVVRGIHFSTSIIGQAKLVTCLSGEIQDVIVDVNPNSKTFGMWEDVSLSEDSNTSVLIGPGMGHGFRCISRTATVAYLLNSGYQPDQEFCVNPFDPFIGIDWKIDASIANMSEKDFKAPNLKDLFK
jgi:dTDP-4-dehydrorhamnose 3,5-epimerase